MPRRLTDEEDVAFERGAYDTAPDEVSQREMDLAQVPTGERDYIALFYDLCYMVQEMTDVPVRYGRRLYHFLHETECRKCGAALEEAVRCPQCHTATIERNMDALIFGLKRGAQFAGRVLRGVHNWDPGRRWLNKTIDNSVSTVAGRVAREKIIRFNRLYKKWKAAYAEPTFGKVWREEPARAQDEAYIKDVFLGSVEWIQQNYPMSEEDTRKATEMLFHEFMDELDARQVPIDELLSRRIVKLPPPKGRDIARFKLAKRYRLES